MRHALEPLQPLSKGATPRVAAEYQIRIFRTMWRSRFFFNALTYLLSEDEELRERYMGLSLGVVWMVRQLLAEQSRQDASASVRITASRVRVAA